jgi:hypothetical protein
VQAAFGSRNTMLRVKTRGAANGHNLHRSMIEKPIEVTVRSGAIVLRESRDFLRIAPVNSDDFEVGNGGGGSRMRLADIAAADDAEVHVGGLRLEASGSRH